MRISTNLIYSTGLNTINAQQSDLLHLYQQIGSGQRMVTAADDPLAASQAINISQAQTLNARYASNRAVANQNLGSEENALNSLTTLLQDVRTRLVQAGNGTLSDADRGTLADVLQNAQQSMLGIANTTDGSGQYLFSGSQGSTPAYGLANPDDPTSGYVYQGDALQRNIQADQTRRIAGGDVGSDIFGRSQPGTLSYTSSAGVANTGTAIIAQPAIVDSSASGSASNYSFAVSFQTDPVGGGLQYVLTSTDNSTSPATTVVAPAAPWVSGGQIPLDDGTTLSFSSDPVDGDTFNVDPNKSNTAATYSFAVNFQTDPVGGGLQYVVTSTDSSTNPATVVKGTPQAWAQGQQSIDLGHGTTVAISGDPAADDTFSVQPLSGANTNVSLFDTFDQLIKALTAPSQGNDQATASLRNVLNTAAQKLATNYDNVLTVRASIGSRMNELTALDDTGTQSNLGYTKTLSGLQDLDYYDASMKLSLRKMALQGATAAFQTIQGLSLFSMNAGR